MPLKSKFLIFLGFRHLFRGLTPLKIENFDQKLKTSTTTPNFFMMFIQRTSNYYLSFSYHWNQKIIFFGISSLISWPNTFKIREFGPKIESSTTTKIFHEDYTEKQQLLTIFIIPLNLKILFFLGFHHLFRGLTPLKFENFDQK